LQNETFDVTQHCDIEINKVQENTYMAPAAYC